MNFEDDNLYFVNQYHQQSQPFIFDSTTTTSDAVGQGLDILNGCLNFGCHQKVDAMEQDAIGYRNRIAFLEAENRELRKQTYKYNATTSDHTLLQQLKTIVWQWDTKLNQQNVHHQESNFVEIPSQPLPSTSNFQSQMVGKEVTLSPELRLEKKDVQRKHSSMPILSAATTVVDEGEGEEFFRFFEPGDGKVLLSDGHQVYISDTKLALMRKKAMKSESRMTRCLLDYFFTPKYLALHSATGEKSSKPALPGRIILAIKAYLLQSFKTSDAFINAIINRKCLDSKRYI